MLVPKGVIVEAITYPLVAPQIIPNLPHSAMLPLTGIVTSDSSARCRANSQNPALSRNKRLTVI